MSCSPRFSLILNEVCSALPSLYFLSCWELACHQSGGKFSFYASLLFSPFWSRPAPFSQGQRWSRKRQKQHVSVLVCMYVCHWFDSYDTSLTVTLLHLKGKAFIECFFSWISSLNILVTCYFLLHGAERSIHTIYWSINVICSIFVNLINLTSNIMLTDCIFFWLLVYVWWSISHQISVLHHLNFKYSQQLSSIYII